MIETNENKGAGVSEEEQIILMKVDYAFKYVMRNENVTKGFIAAVLGVDKEEIVSIEYFDTNTEKDGEDNKLGIMDLLISMNGSKRINIEIQLNYMKYWVNPHYSMYLKDIPADAGAEAGIQMKKHLR